MFRYRQARLAALSTRCRDKGIGLDRRRPHPISCRRADQTAAKQEGRWRIPLLQDGNKLVQHTASGYLPPSLPVKSNPAALCGLQAVTPGLLCEALSKAHASDGPTCLRALQQRAQIGGIPAKQFELPPPPIPCRRHFALDQSSALLRPPRATVPRWSSDRASQWHWLRPLSGRHTPRHMGFEM